MVPVAPVVTVVPPVPDWSAKEAAPVKLPKVTTLAAASLAIPTVLPPPTNEKLPVPTVIVIAPVLEALPIDTAPLPTVERAVGPGLTVRELNTPAPPVTSAQLAELLTIEVKIKAAFEPLLIHTVPIWAKFDEVGLAVAETIGAGNKPI